MPYLQTLTQWIENHIYIHALHKPAAMVPRTHCEFELEYSRKCKSQAVFDSYRICLLLHHTLLNMHHGIYLET